LKKKKQVTDKIKKWLIKVKLVEESNEQKWPIKMVQGHGGCGGVHVWVGLRGPPVCYNDYAVFQDWDMYECAFDDGERLARFLRWRVQVMECGVRAMSLRPGGVNAII
jgi:hypothetical protein